MAADRDCLPDSGPSPLLSNGDIPGETVCQAWQASKGGHVLLCMLP